MNNTTDTQEIDFTNVDWSKLTHEEFHALSNKMNKLDKIGKQRKKNERGTHVATKNVKIGGEMYNISENELNKIQRAKTPEEKQRLINDFKRRNQPIIEI